MTDIILTLICSFFCSAAFGIIFHISYKELPLAGFVGFLTRAALLIAQCFTDNRLIYTLIASVIGAIAAKTISQMRYTTTTKFIYPAFVPIIPGDLLYNSVVSFVSGTSSELTSNVTDLAQALIGLAFGAMIVPLFYRSKDYLKELKEVKIQ